MTGPVFVDTNVLVYHHDTADPAKQVRAESWITCIVDLRAGRLSFQVLQELYATLTHKLQPNLERQEARDIVDLLASWNPLAIDLPLIKQAWGLQDRYSLSWWDALIVAAAQAGDCRVLLTEDLQHGQRFGRVRVIDPFASPERSPADLLASVEAE